MNSELFFDKKRYISTKESSKISGYSSDYIGQLCRSGKLDCKRISNTWFIFSDSLDDYIKENGKPSKALKAVERKKVLNTQTPVKQESLNVVKEEIVGKAGNCFNVLELLNIIFNKFYFRLNFDLFEVDYLIKILNKKTQFLLFFTKNSSRQEIFIYPHIFSIFYYFFNVKYK